MEEELNEIEKHCRESLDMWSEVLTQANTQGWGAYLDFTHKDVMNAVTVMTTISTNYALKHGKISTVEDASAIGEALHSFMLNYFGIDTFKEN
jgi:phage-related protein